MMGVEIVTTEVVTCKHCGSKAVVKYVETRYFGLANLNLLETEYVRCCFLITIDVALQLSLTFRDR